MTPSKAGPISKTADNDKTLAQLMKQGADAFGNGMGADECPHPKNSQEAHWWRRGWGNARMGANIR